MSRRSRNFVKIKKLERAFDRIIRDRKYEEQNQRCKFCYVKLNKEKISRDHYIPKCKGGSNDSKNIVIACHDCNKLKDNLWPKEFWKKIENSKEIPYILLRAYRKINLRLEKMEKYLRRVCK